MKKIIFSLIIIFVIIATAFIAYNKGYKKAVNSISYVWNNGSHFIVEIDGEYHQYEGSIGSMIPMKSK